MAQSPLVRTLEKTLADTYALTLKTQNYHWNVEGPHFAALHALFETQYDDLALAVDTLAETLRTIGAKVEATFDAFRADTVLKSGRKEATAERMVADLAEDHRTLMRTLGKTLAAAQKAGDEATADLLIGRIQTHRKHAWMLSSSLPV